MVAERNAGKKKNPRQPLGVTEAGRIKRRLLGSVNGIASAVGYVCSEYWADLCVSALAMGKVQLRKKHQGMERDLHKATVYPPGGPETSMVENFRTMRYMPPDYTGLPLDDREDRLKFLESLRLPRSCSAVNIESIRYRKARPEKKKIRSADHHNPMATHRK
jgi:hypothetical protein